MDNFKKVSRVLVIMLKVVEVLQIFGSVLSIGALVVFNVIQIDRPDIVTTEMKKLSLSSQEPFTLFICLLINCISLFLVARFTKQIFEWIELSESPFIPQISNQINKISAALFVYIIVPTGSVNEINLSSVVLGTVIVLVLYCLSAVFKYGCSLQKEVDGMLQVKYGNYIEIRQGNGRQKD